MKAAAAIILFFGFDRMAAVSRPAHAQTNKGAAEEVLRTALTIAEALAKCDDEAVRKLETVDHVTVGPTGHLVTAKQIRERDGDRYCRVRVYGGDTAIVNVSPIGS